MDPTSSAATSATNSLDGRGPSGGSSDFLNLGMFGQPSGGVGDILLGSTGPFGGSTLGNGYGNDSAGTSSTPVSSGSSAFDLNDFPSLGGGVGGVGAGASVGTTGSSSSNGLAAALRQQQQQQLLAHQQMLQGGSKNSNTSNLYRLAMQSGVSPDQKFNMATEDFPALPGAPVGGGGSNGSLTGASGSSLLLGVNGGSTLGVSGAFGNGPVSRSSSAFGDIENESHLDGSGLLGGSGLGGVGLGGLQGGSGSLLLQQRSATPSSGNVVPTLSSGPGSTATGAALSGDFGLLGLLSVIRMTDADRNALALGTDLTMLGMNLNSGENLYSNFASPWSEAPATKEPHYQLPMCYYVNPPALKTGHLSKFQLETLFYIFYSMPKDALQAYSAQELHSRDWRYHGDLKRWFKHAGPSDGVANSSSGAPQFLYFDLNTWERRLFSGGNLQNLTAGFLTEDDVRVKFPSS